MADLLRGILLNDCARCDPKMLENLPNEHKTTLRISDLHVDVGTTHASAAAGNLTKPRLLERFVEWIFDFVSTAECKICRL